MVWHQGLVIWALTDGQLLPGVVPQVDMMPIEQIDTLCVSGVNLSYQEYGELYYFLHRSMQESLHGLRFTAVADVKHLMGKKTRPSLSTYCTCFSTLWLPASYPNGVAGWQSRGFFMGGKLFDDARGSPDCLRKLSVSTMSVCRICFSSGDRHEGSGVIMMLIIFIDRLTEYASHKSRPMPLTWWSTCIWPFNMGFSNSEWICFQGWALRISKHRNIFEKKVQMDIAAVTYGLAHPGKNPSTIVKSRGVFWQINGDICFGREWTEGKTFGKSTGCYKVRIDFLGGERRHTLRSESSVCIFFKNSSMFVEVPKAHPEKLVRDL